MLESIQDFIAMGGYASYVWSAYGLTAAVLVVNAIAPRLRERRLLSTLAGRGNGKRP